MTGPRAPDEFELYGYRRVTAELRSRGLLVNTKKVRRLMREHSLNPKRRGSAGQAAPDQERRGTLARLYLKGISTG